jgi:DNA-binding NarL/FixJ family response regulator
VTASGGAAIRVLVVDDHKVVRRGLRAFLDGEPDLSVVGEAADGGEALGDVEIVALTSFVDDERVHAALTAGASGYILKDADADQVAAAIRAAHRGQLQLDAAVARRLLRSLPGPRPPAAAPEPSLTDRERQILRLLAAGRANKEIAAELVIT